MDYINRDDMILNGLYGEAVGKLAKIQRAIDSLKIGN